MRKYVLFAALALLVGLATAQNTGGTGGDTMIGAEPVTLEGTLNLLEGGLLSAPAARALSHIESWGAQLAASDDPTLQTISEQLGELNAALSTAPTDPQRVSELLTNLGESVTVAAADAEGEVAERLTELSDLLTNAGLELAGSTGGGMTGGMDATGGTGGN